MDNKRMAEKLLAELKQALKADDEPRAARIRAEIDAIAKRDARLAGTIVSMLAAL